MRLQLLHNLFLPFVGFDTKIVVAGNAPSIALSGNSPAIGGTGEDSLSTITSPISASGLAILRAAPSLPIRHPTNTITTVAILRAGSVIFLKITYPIPTGILLFAVLPACLPALTVLCLTYSIPAATVPGTAVSILLVIARFVPAETIFGADPGILQTPFAVAIATGVIATVFRAFRPILPQLPIADTVATTAVLRTILRPFPLPPVTLVIPTGHLAVAGTPQRRFTLPPITLAIATPAILRASGARFPLITRTIATGISTTSTTAAPTAVLRAGRSRLTLLALAITAPLFLRESFLSTPENHEGDEEKQYGNVPVTGS